MKVIITGLNGTLAPYIATYFKEQGCEIIPWHRKEEPIDDQEAINQFIRKSDPDLFLHIATGPIEWLEKIIKAIKPYYIPLVFTSSEAVFDESQPGPYTTDLVPEARGDYGRYKIACENIINRDYAENSYIVRLGWQIALHTHKNNMLSYLVNEVHVKASSLWIPSASFMPDTAKALYDLVKHYPPDIYHLDGNRDNWDFNTLVHHLKEAFYLPITIEKTEDYKRNNRLLNTPVIINAIQVRLSDIIEKHQK